MYVHITHFEICIFIIIPFEVLSYIPCDLLFDLWVT